MKRIIFDLDGTIADSRHRAHLLRGAIKDWDEYHMQCSGDAPITHIIAIANAMALYHDVMIMTGRSERAKRKTIKWLSDHGVIYKELLMRPADCEDDPVTLKSRWINELKPTPDNTVCAFDDDPIVVDLWHEIGIPCLQICDLDQSESRFRMKRSVW